MSISQLAIGQTSKRHFLYSYDASGNRIKRMYVLVPCPGCRDAQIATTLEDSLLQLATNQPVEKSNPLEIKSNNGEIICLEDIGKLTFPCFQRVYILSKLKWKAHNSMLKWRSCKWSFC